jgi:dihydroorotate dehydrogenase electron transfer subunit
MDVKNFNTIPETLPIKKIVKETDSIWTFQFEYELGSKPGQFVMLWIPGVDEKPFSIAYDGGGEFWLTIAKVGEATEELFKLKEGDLVGLRGPFGNGYSWSKGEHLVLLAGGYGAAPLYGLARAAVEDGCKVDFVVGARSDSMLLYEERVAELGENVKYYAATDDGSKGHNGYNTEVLEEILAKESGVSQIYACGPEMMMKRAAEIARDKSIPSQLALERYMKCGFGVCGQCCVDESGICVCKEGTVFEGERALGFSEFGKYHRDSVGRKVEW